MWCLVLPEVSHATFAIRGLEYSSRQDYTARIFGNGAKSHRNVVECYKTSQNPNIEPSRMDLTVSTVPSSFTTYPALGGGVDIAPISRLCQILHGLK